MTSILAGWVFPLAANPWEVWTLIVRATDAGAAALGAGAGFGAGACGGSGAFTTATGAETGGGASLAAGFGCGAAFGAGFSTFFTGLGAGVEAGLAAFFAGDTAFLTGFAGAVFLAALFLGVGLLAIIFDELTKAIQGLMSLSSVVLHRE
jgi:hypothetical protein